MTVAFICILAACVIVALGVVASTMVGDWRERHHRPLTARQRRWLSD